MDQRYNRRIILIGFSGTGKSKIAREIAEHLGWNTIDTDEEVSALARKGIAEIFAQDGEGRFREMEQEVLAAACQRSGVVIACGGGAVIAAGNRKLMKESGFVVCLEASPEVIYRRLVEDTRTSGGIRPLLNVPDPLERIRLLKESRQHHYAVADWIVHTDHLTPDEVRQETLRGWYYWSRARHEAPGWSPGDDLTCEVVTATSHYPVYVGWGLLGGLGERAARASLSGTAHIVSDETVFSIYGAAVIRSLKQAGIPAATFVVTPGETAKTLDTAGTIYDWLVERRAERNDTIVALGGGVICDLAGFVAATFLRGLPLVQVPTSLIAMVDASIGGKTGVNHPHGKNLIGAFYQPRLVMADVQTLTTLSDREMISGWAEVIKHGAVLDPGLFAFLQGNAVNLRKLDPQATTEAIRRSAAVKARIVSEDERESGKRILLNYGHTIGHALEAATDYGRFTHGEAVAIGMTGAAMLSHNLGLLPEEIVEEQRALLQELGLPANGSDIDLNRVVDVMRSDKKVRGKALRWVLLEKVGSPIIRDDVSEKQVTEVLQRLLKK